MISTTQEAALVEAILSAPQQFQAVAEVLPAHFGDEVLGRMWAGFHALAEAGRTPDSRNLLEWLVANRRSRDPEWEAEIRKVWTGEVLPTDVPGRAAAVIGHWRLRQLREIGRWVYEESSRRTSDSAASLVDEAIQRVVGLDVAGASDARVVDGRALAMEVRDDLRERMSRAEGNRLPGLPTGWRTLDRLIAGWVPGALSVLKGKTGRGKTGFALAAALAAAKAAARSAYGPHQRSVLIFSLEMDSLVLGQRMLASESGVGLTAIRTGALPPEDLASTLDGVGRISSLGSHLLLCDWPTLSVGTLKRLCRLAARETPSVGLIVLDYLQLVKSTGATREQEVAEVAEAGRELARVLNCHVMMLSQMNADGASRESRVPEHHASVVMTFEPAQGEDEGADTLTYDLVVEKNRFGPIAGKGRCQWRYQKAIQRIDPIIQDGWH